MLPILLEKFSTTFFLITNSLATEDVMAVNRDLLFCAAHSSLPNSIMEITYHMNESHNTNLWPANWASNELSFHRHLKHRANFLCTNYEWLILSALCLQMITRDEQRDALSIIIARESSSPGDLIWNLCYLIGFAGVEIGIEKWCSTVCTSFYALSSSSTRSHKSARAVSVTNS